MTAKDTGQPEAGEALTPPTPTPKLSAEGRQSMRGERHAADAAPKDLDLKRPKDPGRPQDSGRPPDAAEALSPEQREFLRHRTPSATIREQINDVPAAKKVDPVTGEKVKVLEADHIVPFKKICDMPGFAQLDGKSQEAVLNYPPNFEGLSRRSNASKCDKTWAEWNGPPGHPISPELKQRMVARETELSPQLQREIDSRLAHPKDRGY